MKQTKHVALSAVAVVSALYVGVVAPAVIPGLTAVENVSAVEVTGGRPLTTAGDIPAGIITWTKGAYENGIHDTKAVITISDPETDLETILNQKPGYGSTLASFYFGIKLGDLPTYFEKGDFYYTSELENDIDAQKDLSKYSGLSANGKDSIDAKYPVALMVEYKKPGEDWTRDRVTRGNGSQSIRDGLLAHLGAGTELVYGENWRVFMTTDQTSMMAWVEKTAVEKDGGGYNYVHEDDDDVEYVRLRYEIDFPVAAIDGNRAIYYPDLKSALDSGEENVVVSKTISASGDMVIRSGVTLTIADDAIIKLSEDASIRREEDGVLNADAGQILDATGVSQINHITFGECVNDEKTVGGDSVELAGTKVKTTYAARAGYEGQTVVTNLDGPNIGTEIEIDDEGYFVMPANDVSVESVYTTKEVVLVTDEEELVYDATSSEEGLTFKFSGDFEDFDHITVDETEVSSEYYTVESGSTIINLKKDFLDTLGNGEHELVAFYRSGASASASFEVTGATTPDTGIMTIVKESQKPLFGLAIFSAIIATVLAIVKIFKKSKKEN